LKQADYDEVVKFAQVAEHVPLTFQPDYCYPKNDLRDGQEVQEEHHPQQWAAGLLEVLEVEEPLEAAVHRLQNEDEEEQDEAHSASLELEVVVLPHHGEEKQEADHESCEDHEGARR